MNRKQFAVFLVMLVVFGFCIFATYAFFADQVAASGVHFWTDIVFHAFYDLI